jgi:carbon storage regulator
MLVLTRRIGETIVMDGDVRVTVLSIDGGKVRIGITGPPSVRIQREEIIGRSREGKTVPAVTGSAV